MIDDNKLKEGDTVWCHRGVGTSPYEKFVDKIYSSGGHHLAPTESTPPPYKYYSETKDGVFHTMGECIDSIIKINSSYVKFIKSENLRLKREATKEATRSGKKEKTNAAKKTTSDNGRIEKEIESSGIGNTPVSL